MTFRAVTIACALAAAGLHASAAANAAAPPPELPAPTYKSVSKEVLIPMDDGVKIAATVALPSADGVTPLPGRFPVVVGMTPYGRTTVCGCYPPEFWATRGIAGASVDVRGTGGSGGTLEGNYFSPREARDSYNVIEHLGTQPYSSGKVGMAGGSYLGITQYLAAALHPPHLAAIAPQVALSDLYRDAYTHGGVPNLFFDTQYIGVQGAPGAIGPNSDPALLQETLKAKLGQSPPGTIAFDYLARPNDDPFYRDRSPIYNAGQIEVPALIVGGWSDGLSQRGGPEMYQRLARRPGVETRLYMDPCTHKGCGAPFAPLTDPPGQYDVGALVHEFMTKHLQGAATPARPRVQYYLQSKNQYVDANTWPPSQATQRLELVEDGLTLAGDTGPGAGGGSDRYVTNPVSGFSMAFDKYGTVAASPYVPTDQRLEGPNGLTFRTPAVSRPLDLVGPFALHLEAASTASDTDWIAKLADVAPDGSESIITEGALRASHRALDPAKSSPSRPYHTHVDPRPIEPNRFYPYEVEVWPTAYQLKAGHRLQLRVTSTDLPTHLPGSYQLDRNRLLDTRVDLHPPAINTVRLKRSFLTLPSGGQGAARALRPPCLARRSPIGPRNIGRLRLGQTRKRMSRVPVRSPRSTSRSRRYCVKRSRGRVTATFATRSPRARAKLVVTTARHHGNRRVSIGSRVKRFRRAYPRRVRVAAGLYRAGPSSPRLFGIRRGRVRYLAVASRSLARDRRALRRHLRIAGVR